MGDLRLFFGLQLNDRARQAIACAAEDLRFDKGRLHEADNYHLTLVFLGATPQEAVPLLSRLGRLALREPFRLKLAPEMGAFRNGSIIWAGVEPCAALFALRSRLSAMLRENGFPGGDEPFTPHITVGRGMRLTAPPPLIALESFEAARVTLFESARVDGRLTYRPIG